MLASRPLNTLSHVLQQRALPLRRTTAQALPWLQRSSSRASTMPQDKWWDKNTVAVVTGANKGIGFEIARLLTEAGLTVVLTARDDALGEAALKKIKESPAAAAAEGEVVNHQLDITDPFSVSNFSQWIKEKYGHVDVLVNNAGMAFKGDTFGAEEARLTLFTNYFGTKAITEALLPLMKAGGHIVNVSSSAGQLRIIPDPELRDHLAQIDSVQEIDKMANGFVEGIKAGNHRQQGWPNSMYGVSKVCMSAYTRVLAAQSAEKGITVNACCPGYCATDMSSWRGTQSAAAGADTPVWLALQPPGAAGAAATALTGKFFRNREEQTW